MLRASGFPYTTTRQAPADVAPGHVQTIGQGQPRAAGAATDSGRQDARQRAARPPACRDDAGTQYLWRFSLAIPLQTRRHVPQPQSQPAAPYSTRATRKPTRPLRVTASAPKR
jgi:hypothetical protein